MLSRRSLFEVIVHYNKFNGGGRTIFPGEIFQLEFSLMFAIHSSQCTALGVAWHWWLGGPVKSNVALCRVVLRELKNLLKIVKIVTEMQILRREDEDTT